MSRKNLRERLQRMIDDPLSGSIKKSRDAVKTDLRARIEQLEKVRKKIYTEKESPSVTYNNPNYQSWISPDERETDDNRLTYPDYKYNKPFSSANGVDNDLLSLSSIGKPLPEAGNSFALWEHTFSIDHSHGSVLLSSLKRVENSALLKISPDDRLKDFDIEKALFIDTETTGLAGGTGTLAFLIGAGYYRDNEFRVRQYFMRDYGEENAALEFFTRFLREFKFLVTFNGRGFDIPLLQARFILNRIDYNLSIHPQIDLLFPSRDIFKHRLEDCRLITIEKDVIRFHREGDIPGSEIPYLYFKYIRSRNPALIDRIFYHNTMDVVSLSALLAKIGNMFSGTGEFFEYGEDCYGIGHLLFRSGDFMSAEKYFLISTEYKLLYAIRYRLLGELSLIYKRTNRWRKAAEIWHVMIDGAREFDLFPYIELAKYYEHREKSFARAIDFTREAANKLAENESSLDTGKYLECQRLLLHRLKRLERKLKGKPWR